ncbi:hypothetical protein RYX36_016645 [Vicia faba]
MSVEYRLAPEHPVPACYHDCWAALKWIPSHSKNTLNNPEPWLVEHGDFARVFIGGDSAGGNITHNIAIQAGAESLPCDVKILGVITIHPYFNISYPIGSEPVIEPENNLFHQGAPSLEKLGCSRILICVAERDKLRDRGVWYWENVKKSGWNGRLELFEEKDENHVYHLFKPESESENTFIQRSEYLTNIWGLTFVFKEGEMNLLGIIRVCSWIEGDTEEIRGI